MHATNVIAFHSRQAPLSFTEDQQLVAALHSGRVQPLAIALLDHSRTGRLDRNFENRLVALSEGALPSWADKVLARRAAQAVLWGRHHG